MRTLNSRDILSLVADGRIAPPSFDDILMAPSYSDIESRSDPSIETRLSSDFTLEKPIISSPMDTVTEHHMASEIGSHGAMGIIHRFMSVGEQIENISRVLESNSPVAFAMGVGPAERDRLSTIFGHFGSDLDWVSIDVANGHSKYMGDTLSWVKDRVGDSVNIMAGNVATGEGYLYLSELGADSVRVGIGGGSICKTRIMTGFGIPTFSSIIDAYRYRVNHHGRASIIADGGIRYPSDLVKSIAAGADAVMAGRIFAGTTESPGEVICIDGSNYKAYRGMASREVQEERRGGMKPGTCPEGVSTRIELTGSANAILEEFCGGFRSGMTYQGSRNISQFKEGARFIMMSQSSLNESHAFGTKF